MAKSLSDVMEELGIKICPICGNEYTEHPAISRKDNITEICPVCGTKEALESFLVSKTESKENATNYCIFEKRFCRLARKKGSTFSCSAESDEEMLCNYKEKINKVSAHKGGHLL